MRTTEMKAIAERAASHFNGAEGFDNNARKNAYECEVCGAHIVTVDREPGVTPFMVSCGTYSTPLCTGQMTSKMYRVQPWLVPSHEWYRPDSLAGVPEAARHHVEQGGLLLRRIEGESRKGDREDAETLERLHREMTAKLVEAEASAGPTMRKQRIVE